MTNCDVLIGSILLGFDFLEPPRLGVKRMKSTATDDQGCIRGTVRGLCLGSFSQVHCFPRARKRAKSINKPAGNIDHEVTAGEQIGYLHTHSIVAEFFWSRLIQSLMAPSSRQGTEGIGMTANEIDREMIAHDRIDRIPRRFDEGLPDPFP